MTAAGFNPTEVLAGLHAAMEFGRPTRAEDRATFVLVSSTTAAGDRVDDDGVPFDPTKKPTKATVKKQVPCAIEFDDRADRQERIGPWTPALVKITLLDPEYQQVKGFDHVIIGGDKYAYRLTEPPVALGTIDVWTVHVVGEES